VKKYVSILSALVLLLGFAALSYSAPAEIPSDTTAAVAKGQTQITLGGEIQVRGTTATNTAVGESDYSPNFKKGVVKADSPWGCVGTCSYYDYLVKLNLEAKVSPNTTGFVELVSGNQYLNYVPFGNAQGGARGAYQVGNTKESTMWISQAWILYQGSGLLGVPAGIKVGRMPIKLGNGVFLDHTYFNDDAILAFVQPMKELTLAAATIKFGEYYSDLSDDSTAYSLIAAYAGKGWGLSADVTYVDHQNLGDTGKGGVFPDVHLWNFGLRGNYDDIAGTGLGVRADVEFQTGKINEFNGNDVDLTGWAVVAGLDYKFQAIPVKLTLEYGYGSGDKEDSKDIKAFITSKGYEKSVIGTFIYDYMTPTACNFLGMEGSSDSVKAGLCNTQYVKLGGTADITKEIAAELYGFWLQAARSVSLNGYNKDKDLGYEVDAKVTYKIDKGLTYFVEGGYFWPGDAYKLANGHDADHAWAVRHGLILKF
jgi:hypothetical protein